MNEVITTGNENGNEYGDGDEENGGNSGDEGRVDIKLFMKV